jgi:hypothetical protein
LTDRVFLTELKAQAKDAKNETIATLQNTQQVNKDSTRFNCAILIGMLQFNQWLTNGQLKPRLLCLSKPLKYLT